VPNCQVALRSARRSCARSNQEACFAAASELGLPPGEDGLLILPPDSEIGKPVKQLFDSDTLLELEVTPNRPDLLSHYGMAANSRP
jgi:hypothetical protein